MSKEREGEKYLFFRIDEIPIYWICGGAGWII